MYLKIFCLLISLSLTLSLILCLIIWDKPKKLEELKPSDMTIVEGFTEFEIPITTSPSYFSSVGKIYTKLHSPHIKGLKVELSLYKYSWKEYQLKSNKKYYLWKNFCSTNNRSYTKKHFKRRGFIHD